MIRTSDGDLPALLNKDWREHPLGEAHLWPDVLLIALDIIFSCAAPKVVIWGKEHFTFFNPAFAALNRRLTPELLGLPYAQVCVESWELIKQPVNSTLSGQFRQQDGIEIEMPCGEDGRQAYYCTFFTPLRSGVGSINGVLVDVHDTAHHRRLSERLLLENQSIQQIFAKTPILICYVVGPDFRIKFANDAITNLFGACLSEGKTIVGLASELDDPGFGETVLEVYKSGNAQTERREIRGAQSKPGMRSVHYVDFHYQPITDSSADVVGVLCMGLDVTPQVDAQNESDRLRHHVLHSSRINAMGTMAMTLAHELSQPLAAAVNYASAAKRLATSIEPEKREAGISALEGTITQIIRAGEIIRRMRSAMRSGEADRQPVLVTEAVQRAWSLIDSDNVDAALIMNIARDANTVLADGVQLEQVLTNLLRNAVDASHKAVQKDIVVKSHRISDGMVRISIRDFGIGISSERIADILTRELKAESGGLGVGLSLSWTLIDANKGRLHAENAVGGGAIFSFDLEGVWPVSNGGGDI